MPAKSSYSNDLSGRALLCKDVIKAAGALVLKGFQDNTGRATSMKGPQDFLTETDAASEALIRSTISEHFPVDGFLGEEGGGKVTDRLWVVDPIDGTANFARGIPHFCISIAYVENYDWKIGAIYNPAQDELYFACRGAGATLNEKQISVSATRSFDSASVELGWSGRVPNEIYIRTIGELLALGTNVRRTGSGAMALAYVADGRSDAYVELHMNSWDCAAGLLLVEEAGGAVCPFMEIGTLAEGGPVLASTRAIAVGVSQASRIPLAAPHLLTTDLHRARG
ncbi:Extragenic supressor protein SuhB (plasmid) [Neorhizobium galegae bv. officinalis bv. officinalis str. HAMBI 1141]|uniref:Inositol-1-monophosphatase n=1 Tax=Neorhizobium galegae bv. officinalis bv. officinalis str. HAMBI 1141 TaxID=1028801 RepID=A0A068TJA8_NEOGA|nr:MULTISPECIES: inositol monophosphatase family protein [Neorhizobium]MCJ9672248.1 inositol monophosphatase [Neorhizobium sp. SHOUNA12B]MCJ9751239.1 inositol monophosphatase [Neorhizobium sp. BETTINA12A]CDN58166.1 Extragenic supressor protein SuhB [Neorhizobium galegae bv. officinalis bv. officinalis str. HAMBI 1141]